MRSQWDKWIALTLLLILAVGIGVAGFAYPPLKPFRLPLACVGLALTFIFIAGRRLLDSDHSIQAISYSIIGISLLAFQLFLPQINHIKGYRAMVTRMNQLDPERQIPTLVYKKNLPSISFYRQKLAIMALGETRETRFEQNTTYRQWFIDSDAELIAGTSNLPRKLFVVTKPFHLEEFRQKTSFACSELIVNKNYTAYDCQMPKENKQ